MAGPELTVSPTELKFPCAPLFNSAWIALNPVYIVYASVSWMSRCRPWLTGRLRVQLRSRSRFPPLSGFTMDPARP